MVIYKSLLARWLTTEMLEARDTVSWVERQVDRTAERWGRERERLEGLRCRMFPNVTTGLILWSI